MQKKFTQNIKSDRRKPSWGTTFKGEIKVNSRSNRTKTISQKKIHQKYLQLANVQKNEH